MKWIKKLEVRLKGLTDAIARFPLTTLFLVAAAIMNASEINSNRIMISKLLLTFVVGAFLGAVSQSVFERYFSKFSTRFILMGVAVLLTAGYYLAIMQAPILSMEINIKTQVVLFALLISFIWVPAIKSKISFNKSFMISFKSFWISVFFSGVIFGGVSIILGAFDQLIFSIDPKAYAHSANIIFLLFAPLYFLSLIPIFPGENKDISQEHSHLQSETINRAANCPKFLEILISYIMIPLIAVFTLILVLYIFKNIGGEFWADNLLEPMLVSYAITVILVYILASEIENKFTVFFRKVFPKLLVPIVIFQIISSSITLTDTGITHTRYYAILFGIFAVISGSLLSFLSVRKNGIIAPILIACAVISIIPPVDAFTLSKNSQIHTLEEILKKNGMLETNKITPNESIPKLDKEKITNSILYLNMINYINELSYLPKDFDTYEDFRSTFGFDQYMDQEKFDTEGFTYVSVREPVPLNITGNDFFMQMEVYVANQDEDKQFEIEKNGHKFLLLKDVSDDKVDFRLMNENKEDILVFETNKIFEKFSDYQRDHSIPIEEATFTKENERAKMTVLLQYLEIQNKASIPLKSAVMYVFVQLK
jgi:hypothetical protein